MNEEKKTYSVIGKVEIGTDEYRDLIEGLAEAKAKYEAKDHEMWKEYRRANEAEKKAKDSADKLESLTAFINSDEEIRNKYIAFRKEQMAEEEI